MANITGFNPFRELTQFDPFRNLDIFRELVGRPLLRDWDLEPAIKLDVSEGDKAYTVKADLPGVKKENIQVAIDGSQVSISAEVKEEKEEKEGKKVICSERRYAKQSRSFSLAHDIDPAKAEAEYRDGVLQLTLPKKGNGESRTLTVK